MFTDYPHMQHSEKLHKAFLPPGWVVTSLISSSPIACKVESMDLQYSDHAVLEQKKNGVVFDA